MIAFLDRRASHGQLPFAQEAGARRLVLPGAPPAWLLPAGQSLCVIRTDYFDIDRREYALECVKLARALTGHLISNYASLPDEAPMAHVLGVLPEGAGDVLIEYLDGRLHRLPTFAGAYSVASPSPRAILFRDAGKERRVLVPQPPSAAELPLAPGL